jgi:surfactin synthase thioesterase subunit
MTNIRVQEPNQSRPIVFIGHNLGGLVIKEVCTDNGYAFPYAHKPVDRLYAS